MIMILHDSCNCCPVSFGRNNAGITPHATTDKQAAKISVPVSRRCASGMAAYADSA